MNIKVTNVHTVDNISEAMEQLSRYKSLGYDKDHLYVLAHDKDRTKRIAETADAERIGIYEEGLDTAIANIFRSRGDELRAKLKSMGVSPEEAERLEMEMDKDKIVIIAWGGSEYDDNDYDPNIVYYPPLLV
ncbi:general stress protein [Paenibacillus sp. sptzw28]|uniref:general stress protein n=1 Tax=Paenibacillus sp. sptzw28 TaxID=715179 RepID=UPI001C6E1D47|nr:general stress protein [Paenibacillus sp. sptzw28]QYR20581.1 general stress protein [Paenibacillus sp. sptzw28]